MKFDTGSDRSDIVKPTETLYSVILRHTPSHYLMGLRHSVSRTDLTKAGLDSDHHCLFLSGTIFDLMGYENSDRSDEIFSQYIKLTKQSDKVDIRETPNSLDALANEIYIFLVRKPPKK